MEMLVMQLSISAETARTTADGLQKHSYFLIMLEIKQQKL
jgi:hypothetical protein